MITQQPGKVMSLLSLLLHFAMEIASEFVGISIYRAVRGTADSTTGILDTAGRAHAPSFQKRKRDEAAFARNTAKLTAGVRKALNEQWLPSLGINQLADCIKSWWEMTAGLEAAERAAGEEAVRIHLIHIASIPDNARRTRYAASQRFCLRQESDYAIVKVKNGLRTAWGLVTNNAAPIADWHAEAAEDLGYMAGATVLISIAVFLVALAASTLRFPGLYPGKILIFALALLYFPLLGLVFLVRVRWNAAAAGWQRLHLGPIGDVPALNALTLLVEADVALNLARLAGDGVRVHRTRNADGEADTSFGLDPDFKWKFLAIKKAYDILWTIVNCELNAILFLLVFPIWWFLGLLPFVFLLGIQWLISHRELKFDWFRWFGTFCGYFWVVLMIYEAVAGLTDYPYPVLPAVVAGIIVMFATNGDKTETGEDGEPVARHSWWKSWQHWSNPAAVWATLLVLICPYVGIVWQLKRLVVDWNRACHNQLSGCVPPGIGQVNAAGLSSWSFDITHITFPQIVMFVIVIWVGVLLFKPNHN